MIKNRISTMTANPRLRGRLVTLSGDEYDITDEVSALDGDFGKSFKKIAKKAVAKAPAVAAKISAKAPKVASKVSKVSPGAANLIRRAGTAAPGIAQKLQATATAAQTIQQAFPVATIARAKDTAVAMAKNPMVQNIAITAAASALGAPQAAPGIIAAKDAALAIQSGVPPAQVAAQYGAQAVQLAAQSPAFNEFLQNPTLTDLQRLSSQMSPQQIQLANAFLDEAARNVGADLQKLFENAFSIFDYVADGKLF